MTAVHPDEAALVRAIQAAPDDDTPRLAYADWLEEFGSSESHAARAEWIRFACSRPTGGRAKRATGSRLRLPGEPALMTKLAPRLWPHLCEHPLDPEFETGGFVFRVAVAVESDLTRTPYRDTSYVTLRAERGVATQAFVSFVRAAQTAPLVAADEPLVPIAIRVPERVWEVGPGALYIHRRPFDLRDLGGVWDRLELHTARMADMERAKVLPVEVRPGDTLWRMNAIKEALALISVALTEWAREQAQNPLLVA